MEYFLTGTDLAGVTVTDRCGRRAACTPSRWVRTRRRRNWPTCRCGDQTLFAWPPTVRCTGPGQPGRGPRRLRADRRRLPRPDRPPWRRARTTPGPCLPPYRRSGVAEGDVVTYTLAARDAAAAANTTVVGAGHVHGRAVARDRHDARRGPGRIIPDGRPRGPGAAACSWTPAPRARCSRCGWASTRHTRAGAAAGAPVRSRRHNCHPARPRRRGHHRPGGHLARRTWRCRVPAAWTTWRRTGRRALDPGGGGRPGRAPSAPGELDLQLTLTPAVSAVGDVPAARLVWPLRAAPNPLNPRAALSFDLTRPARTSLVIYDVRGTLVRRLLEADLPAGRHERSGTAATAAARPQPAASTWRGWRPAARCANTS